MKIQKKSKFKNPQKPYCNRKEKRRFILKFFPLDILFLLRPPMLIPVWTFFLAGFWRSEGFGVREIPFFIKETSFLNSHFWLSFISYSLLLGSIYIVNQIVDRESDRLNKKLFLIPLGIVPVKLALAICIILVIISFSITFKYGIVYLLFLLLSLIIGLLYSVKPFRFKGKPVIDIFSNAIGYGILAFGVGWITVSGFSYKLLFYAIPYFLATASIFTTSTILDIEGDRNDGAVTTAVKFGKTTTLIISMVSLLLAFISALFLRDIVIVITSVVSFPLLLIALIKRKRKFITLYMRGGSYVFIILLAVLFPWYFILIIFVFLISKLYYKYRFGIRYPALLEREKR